jgi:hypothetical protein
LPFRCPFGSERIALGMEKLTLDNKTVTETRIGKTLFIVTAECSQTASEKVEKKLERLILRHVSDTKRFQHNDENQFAMCTNQSEYGIDNE